MSSLKGKAYAAEGFVTGPLAFATPSHFFMACGNALRCVPVQRSEEDSGEREGETILWAEGASVGALDASSAHGVIAYGERQRSRNDPCVFIWDVEERVLRKTLSCEGELGITSVALCNDPAQARIVVLGEIPAHNILVWDWSRGTMLAKVSAQGSRARCVSFDPSDCNMIASVGTKLELWTLSADDAGEIQLLADPPTNIDSEERELTAHCWVPGKSLFLASDTGEICHVNARTGCKKYGTAWTKVCEGPVGALALSSRHLLVGASAEVMGMVQFVSYPLEGSDSPEQAAYAVEQSVSVDGPVMCLAVSPDWQSLAIATAQGTAAICSLGQMPADEADASQPEDELYLHEVGHGFPDGGINAMVGMAHRPVVCTAGQRGNVTLWLAPSLQIISTLAVSALHEATCLHTDSQANVVVAGTSGGEVTAIDVSNLTSPRVVFRARLHAEAVSAVSISGQWIASAALTTDREPYIALCRIVSADGAASVRPIGRVRCPAKGSKPLLKHMQLFGRVLLATSDGGSLERLVLPDAQTEPSASPLFLTTDSAMLGAVVTSFALEAGAGDDAVTLVGWCLDRALRSWRVELGATLLVTLLSEWKQSPVPGSVAAMAPDHTGRQVIVAGARDGSLVLLKADANNDDVKPEVRHLGAAAAIKGGLSADPSANRQYEPMVVGRGGVSGVVVGAGPLRGWIVSAGRGGSLIAQALDELLPHPRPALPAPEHGVLADAPALSVPGVAPGEEEGGGGGSGGGVGDGEGEVVADAAVLWDVWAAAGGTAEVGAGAGGGAEVAGGDAAERGEVNVKLSEELAALKEKFQSILEGNKTCEEIERLERHELTIDVQEKARMVTLADSQAQSVSMAIRRENTLSQLKAKKIEQNCRDTMEMALLSLVGIDGTAPPGLEIKSFPVAKQGAAEEARLRRVRMMRRLEMSEQALAREHGLPTTSVSWEDGLRMSQAEFQALMGGRGAGNEGPGGNVNSEDADEEGEGDGGAEAGAGVKKKSGDEILLYDALELSTRERRLNQMELQRSRIRAMKVAFNDKLRLGIKDKGSVIDKLEEKKARLAEIKEACERFLFAKTGAEKLEVDDKYALAPSEEEGELLKVRDSEITAPKYLSAAERAAKEAEEAEERARKAAAGSDDAVGRALNDMMYGTLEARKQDEHNIFEEKPVFFDTPKEQLSEEQMKAIAEYEKKLKNAAEDEDKERKTLEAEAKKLKTEMQQLITDFHVRLADLADARLAVGRAIDEAELQIVLLLQAIVHAEDREVKARELARQAETALLDQEAASAAVSALRLHIDEFRVTYETVLTEDKACDKALKKEIADSPVADELARLLKKRTYSHEALAGGAARREPDPFLAVERAQEEALPRPEPIDWEADAPEGLSPMLVERLVELRERKIDSELEVKRKAAELMVLNARLQELTNLEKAAIELCESLNDELHKLQVEREMEAYNLTLLLDVKQGQVEVEIEQMLDETFDAAMIEISQMDKLNSLIQDLGTQKVDMMTDTKTIRNRIHGIRWHNEMLDHKAIEQTENIKYVQLLWVTKDLQSVIKGGGDDRKQAQINTLEKQIDHSKHLHELKVQDMKTRLFRAHKQIREKEVENNKLGEYVQDLAVSVAQREKIMRVRRSEEETADDREYKMQEVVWRRLVLEEARQQSEDIAILKAEVDRLRQRTFPSFAKNYNAQLSR